MSFLGLSGDFCNQFTSPSTLTNQFSSNSKSLITKYRHLKLIHSASRKKSNTSYSLIDQKETEKELNTINLILCVKKTECVLKISQVIVNREPVSYISSHCLLFFSVIVECQCRCVVYQQNSREHAGFERSSDREDELYIGSF